METETTSELLFFINPRGEFVRAKKLGKRTMFKTLRGTVTYDTGEIVFETYKNGRWLALFA